MKNSKSKTKNGGSCYSLLWTLALGLWAWNCSAVYLQPFWYYGRDQFGFPVTNAITIESWPPTNSIVANNTNIILSVSHTFLPDANGFVSNNIALGNYRMQVLGFSAGVPFGILSNANPVNLSMTANVPVTTFLNFTLAQIIDAGSIAGRASNDFALATSVGPIAIRSTNDFALASAAGITNNLGYIPANAANTNDFARATPAGITNSLGYIPANAANTNDFARATSVGPIAIRSTNDFALATLAGITAAQGYTSKTNDGYVGLTSLAGVANITTNGFIAWVVYKTNAAPGPAFTNLPMGSLMSTTNGQFYVLSNLVWTLK